VVIAGSGCSGWYASAGIGIGILTAESVRLGRDHAPMQAVAGHVNPIATLPVTD
jgi:hypothetical protein